MSKKSNPATPRKTTIKAGRAQATPDTAANPESEIVQTAVCLRLEGKSSDWQPGPGQQAKGRPTVVRDFTGFVLFALPPELKDRMGEAVFKQCVADLENHEVTCIHREKDTVSYVRMRCVAQMLATTSQPVAGVKASPAGEGRGKRSA